jgi:hypothetical protein
VQKYLDPTLCALISRQEEWSEFLMESTYSFPKPKVKKNLLRLEAHAAGSAEHKK